MNYIIAILIVYLYAALPFSLLIGLASGKDIRQHGSKNIGGSNLGRVCGKKFFFAGFILDFSKGVFAVLIGNLFSVTPELLGIVAILAHSFSVFVNFKGGKGIATGFGFSFAMTPILSLIAISCFLIVLYISKYVSIAALLASGTYVVLAFIFKDFAYSSLILIAFLLVVYAHRGNIKRLKEGTENKISWM